MVGGGQIALGSDTRTAHRSARTRHRVSFVPLPARPWSAVVPVGDRLYGLVAHRYRRRESVQKKATIECPPIAVGKPCRD